MKVKPMYCCEFCNTTPFDSMEEAQKHEASHFKLTREQYIKWGKLKRVASDLGSYLSMSNNSENRKNFDDAIEELCAFEAENNLSNLGMAKIPSYFGFI